MNEKKKAPADNEAILITLDQIGQTINVMTSVVGRLRGYITEQIGDGDNPPPEKPPLQAPHSGTIH